MSSTSVAPTAVLQALKSTPKGRLSYSPKWDASSEAERRELLAEFSSPTPLSPDTAAYLTERTRRLSVQPITSTATCASSTNSDLSVTSSSPPRHVHSRRHSNPDTWLHTKSGSNTPRLKLELTEGDSPPTSPVATSQPGHPIESDPQTTPHSKSITVVTTVTERSLLAEQEAEWAEWEQSLEEGLQREAVERLRERLDYIRQEEERIAQESLEMLVQSQAKRRREEEVKRAKLMASEMQWKQKIDHEMERLQERYRQHGEELEAKLREGEEQKREIAKRAEERKKQAFLRLQQRSSAAKQECVALLQQLNAAVSSCAHPALLPEAASKAYQTGCQVLVAVQAMLEQQRDLDEEQVAVLHSYVTSVHPLLAEVNSGVEEATQKGQQEAKKRQQEHQQQQLQEKQQREHKQQRPQHTTPTQAAKVQSTPAHQTTAGLSSTPMGIPASMVELYSNLQKKLMQVTTACESLTKNVEMKKYRFDLQKAISTPVNAISGQSGEHLLDKIQRLRAVLAGQRVQVTGRRVSASDHPQGKAYCFNLLAQKIVKQGDEQVSSRSEAAFPVAGVMVSLCVSFPELCELVLAHFHASCPVLVPFYAKSKELSDAERYRLLGYKVGSDGQVEGEDTYLKRMSGIVRLYAAILQTPSEPHPHPHSLENGWAWFARVLNMEPHPTLTATAIYDMLEIAGSALMKAYGTQFQKMLYYICKHYIPCVEKITPVAQQGPLARLKQFLEKCIHAGSIPQPKGVLNDDFWRAHSHGIATA